MSLDIEKREKWLFFRVYCVSDIVSNKLLDILQVKVLIYWSQVISPRNYDFPIFWWHWWPQWKTILYPYLLPYNFVVPTFSLLCNGLVTLFVQQNMAEVACASSESLCTSACSLTQVDLLAVVSQPCYNNMPNLACLRSVRDTGIQSMAWT